MENTEKMQKSAGIMHGWGLAIIMVVGVTALLVAAKIIFDL